MSRHLWQAPATDGDVLIDPAGPVLAGLAIKNKEQLDMSAAIIGGVPLSSLRPQSRSEVRALAVRRDWPPSTSKVESNGGPWIVTGHQPELFHPGVWIKNFAAAGLAAKLAGDAIHLIIDTDTVKSPSLTLPVVNRNADKVTTTAVAFDQSGGETTFERWQCRDEAMFDALPKQILALTRDWGFEPLLDFFWRQTQRFRSECSHGRNVGQRLAFARRQMESSWGIGVTDVLQSAVCGTGAFAHFVSEVLRRGPEFHSCYNRQVQAYRRKYRIRSRNHPAPDLNVDGEWLEMPFWLHRGQDFQRSRMFVRTAATQIEMRFGVNGPSVPVPSGPDKLKEFLTSAECQLRTRALTTTLFARLFLADLFIHGIGGAKYDEVTDGILREFFQVHPPAYAVVTGTLRLPLAAFPAGSADRDALQRKLRDLDWNPDKYLKMDNTAAAELEARRRNMPAAIADRKRRFQELQRHAASLRQHVSETRAAAESQLTRCRLELAANEVLRRRDYPFVLQPQGRVREFCMNVFQLLRAGSAAG